MAKQERFSGETAPDKETLRNKLQAALQQVAKLYAGDGELVAAMAAEHGVEVIPGDMFTSAVQHNYSPRLPKGTIEEVKALEEAASISVFCEDRRQAFEVERDLNLSLADQQDAVIATAGGACQVGGSNPELAPQAEERRQALVEMLAALAELNQSITINLVVHTGVCGGFNYYSGGAAKEANERGAEHEAEVMHKHEEALAEELTAAGVSPELIKMFLAEVEGEEYRGLQVLN